MTPSNPPFGLPSTHRNRFARAGEGYFRMALVPTEEECRRAATILERVL